MAKSIAPKYGLDGYAGQYLPYEGLTVNIAEVMQFAGGQILSDEGARVTVDSPPPARALISSPVAFATAGFPGMP